MRYWRLTPVIALVVACASAEQPVAEGGGAASDSCCSASGSCDNASIAECVCAQDDFCCSEAWDETCVQNVTVFGCGTCAGTAGAGSSWGGGGDGGTGGDPCSGQNDGAFCGTELAGSADPLSVYTCIGGTMISEMPCELGCANGVCSSQASSDPCAPAGYGEYCGAELPQGNPSLLYSCASGITAATAPCDFGCANGACDPPPTTTSDPCSGAYAGNGKYCGSSLPGGDPSKLYTCSNGTTAGAVTCPAECTEMPPGTADECAPVTPPDPCSGATSNSAYCGAALPGGTASVLYTCTNLATTSEHTCPNGCQINATGADCCIGSCSTCKKLWDPCTSPSQCCPGLTCMKDPGDNTYTCLPI